MNYVKEYAGFQVPDGAKYFTEDSRIQRAGFYKWNADELMFYSVSNYGKWEKSINSEVPSCAIELPEAPQDWDGEGLPPVGVECVMSYDGHNWVECVINYSSEHTVVCTNESGIELVYSTKDIVIFRPKRTQKEKDREAFIEAARSIVKLGMRRAVIDEVAGIMYEAGFTAPKDEDND